VGCWPEQDPSGGVKFLLHLSIRSGYNKPLPAIEEAARCQLLMGLFGDCAEEPEIRERGEVWAEL